MLMSQFGRFLLGGAANTALTYALFALLTVWLPPLLAYSVAFATGIAISYVLNALFVFRAAPSVSTAFRFPVVYAAQYGAGLAILAALVERGVDSRLAMLVVLAVTVPLTFATLRVVFRRAAP